MIGMVSFEAMQGVDKQPIIQYILNATRGGGIVASSATTRS